MRLLRKPGRAWGGNINQRWEQCSIVGLCPSPAARGLGCWPAPARLRAVPSAADCPPGVPGTPRDWRQPWLRVPVVLTLPAPRQPFLLLQGGKGSPEPVPRRAQPCGHRPGVAATPRCYLQAEFGAELKQSRQNCVCNNRGVSGDPSSTGTPRGHIYNHPPWWFVISSVTTDPKRFSAPKQALFDVGAVPTPRASRRE